MTDRGEAPGAIAPSAPGEGATAHIWRFHTVIRIPGEATGGAVAVLEHTLPPGTLAMPRHRHASAAEVLHVVSGWLHVELDGTVHALAPGSVIAVPAGASHTFWVDADALAPAVFVAIVTPAGLERYYADVAAAVPAEGKPAMDAVLAAGARHGVETDMESLFELIERHTLQLS